MRSFLMFCLVAGLTLFVTASWADVDGDGEKLAPHQDTSGVVNAAVSEPSSLRQEEDELHKKTSTDIFIHTDNKMTTDDQMHAAEVVDLINWPGLSAVQLIDFLAYLPMDLKAANLLMQITPEERLQKGKTVDVSAAPYGRLKSWSGTARVVDAGLLGLGVLSIVYSQRSFPINVSSAMVRSKYQMMVRSFFLAAGVILAISGSGGIIIDNIQASAQDRTDNASADDIVLRTDSIIFRDTSCSLYFNIESLAVSSTTLSYQFRGCRFYGDETIKGQVFVPEGDQLDGLQVVFNNETYSFDPQQQSFVQK